MSRTWVLALLGGCGSVSVPAEYADALANAQCANFERCELGFFESEFSSQEDCVREISNDIDDASDALDDIDCDFDANEANRCISRVSNLSCEEWVEGDNFTACDLVYKCDADITFSIPTTTITTGD